MSRRDRRYEYEEPPFKVLQSYCQRIPKDLTARRLINVVDVLPKTVLLAIITWPGERGRKTHAELGSNSWCNELPT